nr:MAG TPA: hypothetical protein [Caudoviricetes sp.]
MIIFFIVMNAWRWVIDETAVSKFIAYVWVATIKRSITI